MLDNQMPTNNNSTQSDIKMKIMVITLTLGDKISDLNTELNTGISCGKSTVFIQSKCCLRVYKMHLNLHLPKYPCMCGHDISHDTVQNLSADKETQSDARIFFFKLE